MAIHDVDKSSSDRSSPMPESHDLAGIARMAAGTTSLNYATDSTSNTFKTKTNNIFTLISSGTTRIDYTASTGTANVSIILAGTSAGAGVPFILASYHFQPGPLNFWYHLPYHEFSAVGDLQLQLYAAATYPGSSYYTATFYANIPTRSTYYAANQTFYIQYMVFTSPASTSNAPLTLA